MEYLHSNITGEILNAFYDVYNELGYSFLERVYKNALYKELRKRGFTCSIERSIPVYYQGEIVGDYFADTEFRTQSPTAPHRIYKRQEKEHYKPSLTIIFNENNNQ